MRHCPACRADGLPPVLAPRPPVATMRIRIRYTWAELALATLVATLSIIFVLGYVLGAPVCAPRAASSQASAR